MTVSRRTLMLHIPAVLAGQIAVRGARATPLAPDPSAVPDLAACAPTLAAFIDTLLPAHGASPAASDLGVAQHMLAAAARQIPYARLMQAGCAWLDEAARAASGAHFADLDAAAREAIVTAAEQDRSGGEMTQFFFSAHRHAMELFYSRPRAWPALDYPGPPQPVGFLRPTRVQLLRQLRAWLPAARQGQRRCHLRAQGACERALHLPHRRHGDRAGHGRR